MTVSGRKNDKYLPSDIISKDTAFAKSLIQREFGELTLIIITSTFFFHLESIFFAARAITVVTVYIHALGKLVKNMKILYTKLSFGYVIYR